MGVMAEDPKAVKVSVVALTDSRPSSIVAPVKPTFWQRWFCKPVGGDAEQYAGEVQYEFSYLSIGFITSTILGCVVMTAILAPLLYFYTGIGLYNRTHNASLEGEGVVFNKSEAGPVNQALALNFADPFVIQSNGTWYAYATNNGVGMTNVNSTVLQNTTINRDNVQVATSTDFLNWTLLDNSYNVLPTVGAWASQSTASVWAPAMLQRPSDNKYVLYYSARDASNTRVHCIGAAVSSNLTGPFEALNDTLACDAAQGGSIDPSPFIDDDGSVYVAYKIDGNNDGNGGECGNTIAPIHSTPIMLQRVNDDGVTVNGTAVEILDRTAADGPLVEAPSLVKVDGTYFLFYSSGCTRDPSYTVKYAYASNIEGPYTRAEDTLLMTGDDSLSAPGSCTVSQAADGRWAIAFHARVKTDLGGIREMFTAGLEFSGTNVTLVTW